MNEKKQGIILLSAAPDRVAPGAEEKLRQAGENREVLITCDQVEIERVLDKIEIGMGDVPFGLLSRMPNLQWVQLWSAGADRLQRFPELKALPFKLTTTSGIHSQQLAEHIFGLILAWNRSFPAAFAAQKRREWLSIDDGQISVLQGKTMIILGYGAIGITVARIALAFGMEVIGLRRNPAKGGGQPGVRLENASKLRELLPQADHLVNILPATGDTRHIIGKAEFDLMKRTALYINAGRGTTTDEAALVEALKSKRIAGALLDVTETEPLPGDSPLWGLENVILSGHYAGMHPDYAALALEVALDNLGRYVRGQPLKNLVDKQAGY
jgi:phosphoglycerate dehydrogenase-like enzyme